MPRPDWADLLGAVVVSAPPAALAVRAGALTRGGALAGFLCAVPIYLGTFLAGIGVLGVALLLTLVATRAGHARKLALGVQDTHDAPRGARNVLANCVVAAIGGGIATFSTDWQDAGSIVVVAGLAAGASDTVASEIGKAYGGRPRAFPGFHAVPPGTPGAVSAVGTLAGVAACGLITVPAVGLWLLQPQQLAAVLGACLAGAFIESALATGLEKGGTLNNDTLNLLNTATAAGLALWWA